MNNMCMCQNPNGFRFDRVEETNQVWIHIKCGGELVKPMITSGRKEIKFVFGKDWKPREWGEE